MARLNLMILAAAFISGACSLIVEIAGVRVLAPYLGATIYSWAAVIGFVLASLSIGYYAGGVLADRQGGCKLFSFVLLCAGLLTLIVPFLGAALLPFTLYMEIIPGSLVGAAILVPASLFYGMVSPFAIKLTSLKGLEGQGAGNVFAVSTLGSIAGALGTGFILIPNMAISHIFVSAALLMLISSIMISGFRKERLLEFVPFAAIAFLLISAQLGPHFRGETLLDSESEYYRIRVMELEWNGAPSRVMFLDNAPSTGERADGSPAFTYVQETGRLYPALAGVREALVIGAGGGTEIKGIKAAFPDARVSALEIDPDVVEAGKRYFSLEDDERTEIVIGDARRFVRTSNATFDLVVVDVFRGASPPYHLATREFLLELRALLAPGGVVIVNIISPIKGRQSELFQSFYSTYSSAFANVAAIPTRDDLEKPQNIILLASDGDLSPLLNLSSRGACSLSPPGLPPLTDELNPIELYAVR